MLFQTPRASRIFIEKSCSWVVTAVVMVAWLRRCVCVCARARARVHADVDRCLGVVTGCDGWCGDLSNYDTMLNRE